MPFPSCFRSHAEYLQWYRDYRARNREHLRRYKASYMKAYRAAGRDKSRAGKVEG